MEYTHPEGANETILSTLADLFSQMASSKKKFGVIQPRKFISRVKKENVIFNNMQQQDSHELLNYLLNTIADLLAAQKPEEERHNPTWIHDIFQGILVNETRCLCCETVRSREETFLDLSVDIDQNTSITHCLRMFSSSETLSSQYKYYCEYCCSKQEATKRLRVKKLPMILALHLKRFKYVETMHRFTKVAHRVVFPWELKLFNTSNDASNPNRMYDLVGVVVHCGTGPNRGHYITIVKSYGYWLLFDDDYVEEIEPHTIEQFFGLTDSQTSQPNESGYILFYQSRDKDL